MERVGQERPRTTGEARNDLGVEAPGELSRTPRRMAVTLSRLWKPLVGRGYFTGL